MPPIISYSKWNEREFDEEEQIEPYRKYFFICEGANPSLTLPKKERTENKLKKSRFYADFFELFLLTNTENYDTIYLI